MSIPTLKELLEAGAHFGHKKARSWPQSKPYTFALKDEIYIINLEKTQELLQAALKYLEGVASEGKIILLVGTKTQAKEVIAKAAQECKVHYINHRWLGGMLTNFETIKKNLKHLQEINTLIESENFAKMPKAERIRTELKLVKLKRTYGGIESLKVLPDVLFIIDAKKEETAVKEARRAGVKVVAVCDTDANPSLIDYPIPANDDAPATVKLIVDLIKEAILAGKAKIKNLPAGKTKSSPAGKEKPSADPQAKTTKKGKDDK